MELSNMGNIALQKWHKIPTHYPNVILDEFTVMPNHIHGIIQITRRFECPVSNVGAQHLVPIPQDHHINANSHINKFQGIVPGSLGSIVRGYKIGVAKNVKIL